MVRRQKINNGCSMSEKAKTLEHVDSITDSRPVKRLSCLEAMRERRGEVTCFTPALLVTHGKLPIDPVREFATRFNLSADEQPFCVEVPEALPPFFRGLGVSFLGSATINWDRRLYAVPNTAAKRCIDYMGGIGVHGPDFFASSVTYELNIPDPTVAQFIHGGNFVSIPIYVFGVLIADALTYLAPNGYSAPIARTVPAKEHLRQSGNFKFNPLTQTDIQELKGET